MEAIEITVSKAAQRKANDTYESWIYQTSNKR